MNRNPEKKVMHTICGIPVLSRGKPGQRYAWLFRFG